MTKTPTAREKLLPCRKAFNTWAGIDFNDGAELGSNIHAQWLAYEAAWSAANAQKDALYQNEQSRNQTLTALLKKKDAQIARMRETLLNLKLATAALVGWPSYLSTIQPALEQADKILEQVHD